MVLSTGQKPSDFDPPGGVILEGFTSGPVPLRYNCFVRRKSAINRTKRLSLIERARRMTPEDRLVACANLAKVTTELQRAGKRHRDGGGRNDRP